MQPEAAEVYTALIQRAWPRRLDLSHSSLQIEHKHLIDLMLDIGPLSPRVDPREVGYWMETVAAMGAFTPRSDPLAGHLTKRSGVLAALWQALECIALANVSSTEMLPVSPADFVLETFEWLSRRAYSGGRLEGIEQHPRLVTFIVSGLADKNGTRRERWQKVIYQQCWFGTGLEPLPESWMNAGLGLQIIKRLRGPNHWLDWLDSLMFINWIIIPSTRWVRKLVEDGFIGSIGSALRSLDAIDVASQDDRKVVELFALRVLLDVWARVSNDAEIKLSMEKLVPIIGRFLAILGDFVSSRIDCPNIFSQWCEGDAMVSGTGAFRLGCPVPVFIPLKFHFSEIVALVGDLQDRLNVAAFLSCNADVAINRLLWEWKNIDRGPFDWNYDMFGNSKYPNLCSRRSHICSGLL